MAFAPAYHESLPYVDTEPTSSELDAARALVAAEAASSSSATPLPPLREANFSPLVAAELDRVAASTPLPPLDTSRYEAQDVPAASTSPDALRDALSKSYVSSAYLTSRLDNLGLLDRYGRNAWLLSNYHLEADLRSLERDLATAKRDIDTVNAARASAQNHVRAEMQGLDDDWKKGVARILETELAVEDLKAQIRDHLRSQTVQAQS